MNEELNFKFKLQLPIQFEWKNSIFKFTCPYLQVEKKILIQLNDSSTFLIVARAMITTLRPNKSV